MVIFIFGNCCMAGFYSAYIRRRFIDRPPKNAKLLDRCHQLAKICGLHLIGVIQTLADEFGIEK